MRELEIRSWIRCSANARHDHPSDQSLLNPRAAKECLPIQTGCSEEKKADQHLVDEKSDLTRLAIKQQFLSLQQTWQTRWEWISLELFYCRSASSLFVLSCSRWRRDSPTADWPASGDLFGEDQGPEAGS
jgi:hypothetical protein